MGFASRCNLKIPFPSWARDNKESPEQDFENWKEVERWADDFQKNCLSGGAPVPFLVAAADAPAAYRAAADYLCDGTADEVEINEAVTDAGTVGAEIWLSPGTFYVADSIYMGSGYATLRGCGPFFVGTVIIPTFTGSGAVVDLGGGSSVRNLYIDGNLQDVGAGVYASSTSAIDSVFIADLGATGGSQAGIGINVVGAADTAITNCLLWDIAGAGITTGEYARVSGNYVRGAGLRTSLTDWERAGIFVGSRCTVVNNVLFECHVGIFEDDVGNAITGNNVSASGAHGIASEAGFSTISNNFVAVSAGHGIYLTADECVISGNRIQGSASGMDGIHLAAGASDHFITGNSVAVVGRDAVRVDASSCNTNCIVGNDLRHSTLSGAPITDNGTGTVLLWPADATYGDNFT